jgi:hypothetical protein
MCSPQTEALLGRCVENKAANATPAGDYSRHIVAVGTEPNERIENGKRFYDAR